MTTIKTTTSRLLQLRHYDYGGGGRGGDTVTEAASVLFFDLAVCTISTFNVGIRSTYQQMSSVCGQSMSGNSDTKMCPHSKNHVAKIGLSGQNLATFCHVADMSPTLPNQVLRFVAPDKDRCFVASDKDSWNCHRHVGNMSPQHLFVTYFWPSGHV
jgi:hypothetical protein